MAEVKPGTKACDRCTIFAAVPTVYQRTDALQKMGLDAITDIVKVDLCLKCAKLVDNAIKRAVKAK